MSVALVRSPPAGAASEELKLASVVEPAALASATTVSSAATVRHRFDHKDFLWCPRHANTPRQLECTRLITADQVKAVIRTIPGFGNPLPQPGQANAGA